MKRYAYVGGLTALATTFLGLAAADPSLPVAYCATVNTATTSANFSTYQSMGLCYDFCNDAGYALGVVQSNDCWCSDYVPGDTVSTSECESGCPGYPTDYCGGDGTYGYLKLTAAVSGTQSASSSTKSSSTSTSTSSSTSTSATTVTTTRSLSQSIVTVTETPAQTSVTFSSSSSSSDHTTTSTTSLTSQKSSESIDEISTSSTTSAEETTTSSSSDIPSIVTSVKTVTSNGQIVYQTITSTAEPLATNDKAGLSGGAVAGIVIGILIILAAFIAGALLYRRHKKNRENMDGTPLAGGMAGGRRGSSAGIMSKTGTISSSGYGMGMEEDTYGSHRMSLKPMDPRLDPKQTFGLYRAASHDSINTLRDDHDYSRRVHQPGRVLRVTNMDPTDNDP